MTPVSGAPLLNAGERLRLLHRRRRFTLLVVEGADQVLLAIKLARTAEADAVLAAEHDVLDAAVKRGAPVPLAPRPVRRGTCAGHIFTVSSYVEGRKALLLGERTPASIQAAYAAADRIAAAPADAMVPVADTARLLHTVSGATTVVAEGPIADCLTQVEASWRHACGDQRPAVLMHGDFTAANLLYGDRDEVSAIDWGSATFAGWPLVDHLTLAFYLWTKYGGLPAHAAATAILEQRRDEVGGALNAVVETVGPGRVLLRPALLTMLALRALRLEVAGRHDEALTIAGAATAAGGMP